MNQKLKKLIYLIIIFLVFFLFVAGSYVFFKAREEQLIQEAKIISGIVTEIKENSILIEPQMDEFQILFEGGKNFPQEEIEVRVDENTEIFCSKSVFPSDVEAPLEELTIPPTPVFEKIDLTLAEISLDDVVVVTFFNDIENQKEITAIQIEVICF